MGPTYYVLARLLWSPGTLSVDDLLSEYYEGFGPARDEVRAYWEFWETFTMTQLTPNRSSAINPTCKCSSRCVFRLRPQEAAAQTAK